MECKHCKTTDPKDFKKPTSEVCKQCRKWNEALYFKEKAVEKLRFCLEKRKKIVAENAAKKKSG